MGGWVLKGSLKEALKGVKGRPPTENCCSLVKNTFWFRVSNGSQEFIIYLIFMKKNVIKQF